MATPLALGQLFREERKRQGLTLEEVYALTGLSIRFLSEFERGKANASLGRVMLALHSLGLEIFIAPRSSGSLSRTNERLL
ncbi:helix-turn-helix domain-containing protein [Chrysiogenes arsenatis]|uniref:helix-turn-helix domain-containing protein n=1 Tax=Chrysiogenes arsenatis TaxID=309797 RepID=UPI0004870ACA|nr:helix-turn-helix domain-containing protein [Chrysiogenes arsenatis]